MSGFRDEATRLQPFDNLLFDKLGVQPSNKILPIGHSDANVPMACTVWATLFKDDVHTIFGDDANDDSRCFNSSGGESMGGNSNDFAGGGDSGGVDTRR